MNDIFKVVRYEKGITSKVVNKSFNESWGLFKVTLENNDHLLLTRKQYGEMVNPDNQEQLMFESTSGNFYKPIVNDGYIDMINA